MNILEFFYDYECPFCKQGFEYLLKYLPSHPEITVVWRPTEGHPRPEDWPPHTDLAMQGFYFAKVNHLNLAAYNTRLFKAVHLDQSDIEDPVSLTDYTADLVDRDAYLKALQDGAFKLAQEQGNDYAYEEKDVWYLPALRMNKKSLDAVASVGVTEKQIADFLQQAKRDVIFKEESEAKQM